MDQGNQFTSFAWTDRLRRSRVCISMDGTGRFLDNIFVERLWRSLKHECVYLHAWETGSEAKAGVGKWIEFYNRERLHSALGGKPPAVVYWLRKNETNPDQQEHRVANLRWNLSKDWGVAHYTEPIARMMQDDKLNRQPDPGIWFARLF